MNNMINMNEIRRYLDGEISAGKLNELVTEPRDLIGGFTNIIDELSARDRCYIDKAAVAKRIGKTLRTVDNWIKGGLIPYYKVGRTVMFKWDEIEAHMDKHHRVIKKAQGSSSSGPSPT